MALDTFSLRGRDTDRTRWAMNWLISSGKTTPTDWRVFGSPARGACGRDIQLFPLNLSTNRHACMGRCRFHRLVELQGRNCVCRRHERCDGPLRAPIDGPAGRWVRFAMRFHKIRRVLSRTRRVNMAMWHRGHGALLRITSWTVRVERVHHPFGV